MMRYVTLTFVGVEAILIRALQVLDRLRDAPGEQDREGPVRDETVVLGPVV